MTPLVLPWLKLAICAALIGIAGTKLSYYADVIARLTGLSRAWVGLLLLATATSLPELFTGISSVAIADAPDIAVGDAFGSCIFNLMILVVIDALSRDQPMYRRIEQGHILTAGFGVILIAFAGALTIVSRDELDFRFLHVSLYTPFIVVLYLVAMRAAFVYERRQKLELALGKEERKITLGVAISRYLVAAAVIVLAGSWLPFVGIELADAMGWRTTFVGTLFVAGATSLPELVVTISAFRLGIVDMAIANLLGSNLFDMLILAIDDIVYTKGSLLASVSPAHSVSAFAAVMMSGIFIVALLFRPETRLRGTISWVSISFLTIYLLSSYFIFLHGG